MSLKVLWRHYSTVAAGAPGGAAPGVARGYFRLAFHLYQSLQQAEGVEVYDWPDVDHPKVAFHICPPHLFTPIPGKLNVLMSMWEGGALPPELVENMARADWCVVPSRYCQSVWRYHGLEAAVVPLGLHDAYVNADSARPILLSDDRELRFLWLGSKLRRKGWEFIAPAWKAVFRPEEPFQLWMKTIGDGGIQSFFGDRFVLDERDLDDGQIFRLYEEADVFLFPSWGEGFGLPALEAMASGCLVVAPETTGLTEFVNQWTALTIPLSKPMTAEYGGYYRERFPTVEGLAACLARVKRDWGTPALETIRRSGTNYAKRFTWEASAQRLREVLEAIVARKGLPQEEALVES